MDTVSSILTAIFTGAAALAAIIAIYVAYKANVLSHQALSETKTARESNDAPRLILSSERLFNRNECYKFKNFGATLCEESVSIGRMAMDAPANKLPISGYAIIINTSRQNASPAFKYDNFAEITLKNVGFDLSKFIIKNLTISFADGHLLVLKANPRHDTYDDTLLRGEPLPILVSYHFDEGQNELLDRAQNYDAIISEKIEYANGNLFKVKLPRLIDLYRKLEIDVEMENTKGVKYRQIITLEIIDNTYRPNASIPEIISS